MDLCINFDALRKKLFEDLNSSNLTIGAALFVLKDVYNVLYEEYKNEMQKELQRQNIKTESFEVPMGVIEVEEEKENENGEQNND